jgi:hypothetical protein
MNITIRCVIKIFHAFPAYMHFASNTQHMRTSIKKKNFNVKLIK